MGVTPTEAKALARSAYLFAFPLVDSYRELYIDVIDPRSQYGAGGFGNWRVEPNARSDVTGHISLHTTLMCSSTWLDLRSEPWLIKSPSRGSTQAIERFHRCRASDLWRFAIGECTRASEEAGAAMLVPPAWSGGVPAGVVRVIRGDSAFVHLESCIQMPGPDDAGPTALTDQLCHLEPLSAHLGLPAPASAPALHWMPCDGGEETGEEFWPQANFALSLTTPHSQDREMLDRLARLGIVAGQPWAGSSWSPDVAEAIDDGMADALSDLMHAAAEPFDLAVIHRTRADTDRDYFNRALASLWRGTLDRYVSESTARRHDLPSRSVLDGNSP